MFWYPHQVQNNFKNQVNKILEGLEIKVDMPTLYAGRVSSGNSPFEPR